MGLFNKFINYAYLSRKEILSISCFPIIRSNKKYMNIHKGKRCFIFGNGPSISDLDFSVFEYEYVFTVNQIARNVNFPKLKSNFHFWADSIFFNLDYSQNENKEIVQNMINVNTDNNVPECFFPIEFKKYLEESGIALKVNTNYFLQGYDLQYFLRKKCDCCSVIPSFYTVVQYAIYFAIYMGFSEIYLLGCETSGILTSIKARLNTSLDGCYGYDLSENEMNRMRKCKDIRTYESELYSDYRVVRDYRLLNKICENNNISLFNCTPTTLIESVPQISLNEVVG